MLHQFLRMPLDGHGEGMVRSLNGLDQPVWRVAYGSLPFSKTLDSLVVEAVYLEVLGLHDARHEAVGDEDHWMAQPVSRELGGEEVVTLSLGPLGGQVLVQGAAGGDVGIRRARAMRHKMISRRSRSGVVRPRRACGVCP